MATRVFILSCCLTMIFGGPLCSQGQSALPDPEIAALSAKFESAMAAFQEAFNKEKTTLTTQYTGYLLKLEEKLQSAGNLDRILKVREERELVASSGKVTTHSDPELDRARESFLAKSEDIRRRSEKKEKELKAAYMGRLQAMEIDFTKAGKITSAVAAREERERILAVDSPVKSSSNAAASSSIPDVSPPLAGDNPFKNPIITESMTIPPGRYRLRERVELHKSKNNDQNPSVVFPAGADIAATGDGALFLGRGQLIAREASFSDLSMTGDLSSRAFFVKCAIKNSTFGKGGPWAGSNHASRWHFENCIIERAFIPELAIKDVGLRVLNCTLKGVDLPTIKFGTTKVSEAALSNWLQVRKTRFEKCKIPLSFLLITDSCIFVDCVFIDDVERPALDKTITVTVYEQNCTWRAKSALINMNIEKRPIAELQQ